MLQHRSIARHQCRSGKTEHLPEGEVPGHYRQHYAQRLKGHKALAGVGGNGLVLQEPLCVVGVEIAVQRAFFHFGLSLSDRLAHLQRNNPAVALFVLAEVIGRAVHQDRAFRKGCPAPLYERVGGVRYGRFRLSRGEIRVFRQ